jgi:hypothetical protein
MEILPLVGVCCNARQHQLLMFTWRMTRPVNRFGPIAGLPLVGLGSFAVQTSIMIVVELAQELAITDLDCRCKWKAMTSHRTPKRRTAERACYLPYLNPEP